MNSDWNESWNEYTDMLFAVDNSQKILGTFFSKGLFTFNSNNTITSTNPIMWLNANEQGDQYDYSNSNIKKLESIKYLYKYNIDGTNYDVNNPIAINNGIELNGNTINMLPSTSISSSNTSSLGQSSKIISKKNQNTATITPPIANVVSKVKLATIEQILKSVLNKTFSGGEIEKTLPEDIVEINGIKNMIENFYIPVINKIIYNPVFYKLTALKEDQFLKMFGEEFFLYTGQATTGDFEKFKNVGKIVIDLISFMYIDISGLNKLISNINLLEFFRKGYDTQMYEKYSNNYNDLINNVENNDSTTNTNVIVYISEFINLLSNLIHVDEDDNYNIIKNNLYQEIYNIIIQHCEHIQQINENNYLDYFNNEKNSQFRDKIDHFIKENNDDNIITYLKIRNTDKEQWNERFNLSLNDTNIRIDYCDDNFPYYVKDGNEYKLSKEIGTNNIKFEANLELNMANVKKYDYNYLFGQFNKIFKPAIKNKDIANSMDTIINKIQDNKPVFMIGYGASGAGKTSSLIYLNKTLEDGTVLKEEGILLNLCNIFAGEKYKYTNIELQCKEFYHSSGQSNYPLIKTVPETGSIKFNYDAGKGSFVLTDLYTHSNIHPYRHKNIAEPKINKNDKKDGKSTKDGKNVDETTNIVKSDDENDIKSDDKNGDKSHVENGDKSHVKSFSGGNNKQFPAKTPLGEVIIYLIDTDRFVKATTNNPNSSRSHTLVFVKLIKQEGENKEERTIIIGDFAGVENKFACSDDKTIKAFLNVKRDNVKGADGKPVLYYSTEAIDGNPDPIDNNDTIVQSSTENSKCMEEKEEIYDFDKPVVRDSWNFSKDVKNDLNTPVFEGNPSKLKFYIDVIQKSGLSKEVLIDSLTFIKDNYTSITDGGIVKKLLEKEGYLPDESNIPIFENARKYFIGIMKKTERKYIKDSSNEKYFNAKKYLHILNNNKTYLENIDDDLLELLVSELEFKINFIDAIVSYIETKKFILNKTNYFENSNITINGKSKQIYDNISTLSNLNESLFDAYSGVFNNDKTDLSTGDTTSIEIEIDNNAKKLLKIYKNTLHTFLNTIEGPYAKPPEQGRKQPVNPVHIYNFDITQFNFFIEAYNKLKEYININLINKFFTVLKGHKDRKEQLNKFVNHFTDVNDSGITQITLFKKNTEPELPTFTFVNTNDINEQLQQMLIPFTKGMGIEYENLIKFSKSLSEKKITPQLLQDMIIKIGDENELFEKVKAIEEETKCRIENAKVICENRTNEGVFINKSLEGVRNVIKKILFEKNKDSINISPNFINICLKNYCPQGSNCFKFDGFSFDDNGNDTGSVIFNEIFEYLKIDDYTIQKMYQEIIVSIFCVFNISREANNPPPTPYIDINRLKSLFYYQNILDDGPIQKLEESKGQVSTNEESDKKSIKQEFIIECKNVIQKIDSFKDKVSELYNITFKPNKTVINEFISVVTAFENPNKNFLQTYNGKYKNDIQNFINIIDNNNAVSAIGTLEFLDQIAKFNTVKTICSTSDKNITNDIFTTYEKKISMKPLYKK
jgi:hypothetical protein